MEDEAEDGLAVLQVLRGVEDVVVPELVELLGRHHDHVGVEGVEQEEPAVHDLQPLDGLLVHALVLKLRHDRRQVESFDGRLVLFTGLARVNLL